MYTVYETLQNLGVKDKPVITVFNKIDRMEDTWVPRDLRADYHVKISAKTGEGITGFLQSIEAVLRAFVPAELYGQVRPEGVTPNNCL